MATKFNIWEGIYRSFQEAEKDAVGNGFSGDIYNERALKAAEESMQALQAGKPIPQFHKQRSTILPAVTAMMLGDKSDLTILDFGGGLGIGYMVLAESIPDYSRKIIYHIIELPEICEFGRKIHAGSGGIDFIDSIPLTGHYDLVHSSSALQYVEDWQGLISKFASFDPKYILLSDVFAGPINTFVTLQNYYGSKIKHWFFNFEEFLSFFLSLGYKLEMKSYVTSRRLELDDILPMDNFPDGFRLGQTLHLLFSKL